MKKLLSSIFATVVALLISLVCQAQCPIQYTVEGPTTYCANSSARVELSNSQVGATYQLLKRKLTFPFPYENIGVPQPGNGGRITFYGQSAGSFKINATMNGCTAPMNGSLTITALTAPGVQTLTASSNCKGNVVLTLDGSNPSADYYLKKSPYTSTTNMLPGTGQPLTFNVTSDHGSFTVFAVNTSTSCTQQMNVVTIYDDPQLYTMSSDATECGGSASQIFLNGSQTGVNYQLQSVTAGGDVNVGSALSGTGLPLTWSIDPTAVATYKVKATVAYAPCSRTMTGLIKVNIPVSKYSVSANSHCVGVGSATIQLSGSEIGVSYKLKKDGADYGAAVAGTGSAISWPSTSASGLYIAYAIIPGSTCATQMYSAANLIAEPTAFTVTGSSTLCQGEEGVITMSGSQSGVRYELIKIVNTFPFELITVVRQYTGTGSAMTFNFTAEETARYRVRGILQTPYGDCVGYMSGEFQSTVTPSSARFTVSSNSNCANNASIVLSGSTQHAFYQLQLDGVDFGAPKAGTNAPLQWDNITTPGAYTVLATRGTCTRHMISGALINPIPAVFSIGGSDAYCSTSSSNAITLSGSETGVTYELLEGVSTAGWNQGTGGTLSFPLNYPGTYKVRASTSAGCTSFMTGEKVVPNSIDMYTLEHSGTCSSYFMRVPASQEGVTYDLYRNGSFVDSREGNGYSVNWANTNAPGSYTVTARRTVNAQTCVVSTLMPVTPIPNSYGLTGGTFCIGGTATITLHDTDPYVYYQPGGMPPFTTNPNNFIPTPPDVYAYGTGGQVEMTFTGAGSGYYKVRATSMISGCMRVFSGSASITMQECGTAGRVKSSESFAAPYPHQPEEQETESSIFPNPARELIRVRLPENFSTDSYLAVINSTGMQVAVPYQIQERYADLDIRDISAGTYLLKITSGHAIEFRRFSKQ